MVNFDYKLLLEKYIAHVGREEGVTFLAWEPPSWINAKEWSELQKLDKTSRRFDQDD